MTHPHFIVGLFVGLTLSVACFLYGASRKTPDLGFGQMPKSDQRSQHASGLFTGP